MKYRKTLTCGQQQDRPFKHITIDYPYGHPLRLKGVEVGGVLMRNENIRGLTVMFLEGIEIDPEYRNRGIGKAVIKLLLERCDMLIGTITEDEAKPFWLKTGAVFRSLPKTGFPEYLIHTVTSEDPVFFFITKNPQAVKLAEEMAERIPKEMAHV